MNVHGTSTPAGRPGRAEGRGGRFRRPRLRPEHLVDQIHDGHLLGATGAVEALACILALTQGVVPPTINVEELDPQIDAKLNLTLGTAQRREVRAAMSNTFGFGGHNSTIVFRKL